eukprot:1986247-Pyramimonas_sp.AAC.1
MVAGSGAADLQKVSDTLDLMMGLGGGGDMDWAQAFVREMAEEIDVIAVDSDPQSPERPTERPTIPAPLPVFQGPGWSSSSSSKQPWGPTQPDTQPPPEDSPPVGGYGDTFVEQDMYETCTQRM